MLQKIPLLIIIICLLSVHVASAQQVTADNYTAYARSERDTMKVKLQLTDAQAEMVEEVMKSYYLKLAELSVKSLSLDERADSLSLHQQRYDSALKAVFSEEQYRVHKQLLADRRVIMLQKIEEARQLNNH